jgi:hypothetical protein
LILEVITTQHIKGKIYQSQSNYLSFESSIDKNAAHPLLFELSDGSIFDGYETALLFYRNKTQF